MTDDTTVSVETEAGTLIVRPYRHHKTKLRLPTHPHGKRPIVIDPANVTAKDCDNAGIILFIQRQLADPKPSYAPKLSYSQIRALDSSDRIALVEAIFGGAA